MPVNYAGQSLNLLSNAYRYMSPAIWSRFPIDQVMSDPSFGLFIYDDFTKSIPPLAPTLTTQIAYGPYKAYAAAGCTIARVTTVNSVELMGGALEIGTDTDDDEASIAGAESVMVSGLKSNSGLLCFECCYAQNSVATNMASTFFGLGETDRFTLGANVPHNSGDAINNSGAMIGFRIEEDGLGVVDTVVSDRATSFTNIGNEEAGTLTANTFRKFGFVYDPFAEDKSKMIVFYANNQALATEISYDTLTGYTNLDANALGLLWSVAADSAGTSFKGWMKWWAVAQLFPKDY